MTERLLRSRRLSTTGRLIKFFAICCICGFTGVAPSLDSGAQPKVAEFPDANVTLAVPGELKGMVRVTTGANANRCTPNPVEQLRSLRDHGDILGFRMGAGYPDPNPGAFHWQGVQRLPIGGGRLLAVSSSTPAGEGGHVAIVQLGSRAIAGGRLRSNRLSTTTQDWNVRPGGNDVIVQDLRVSSVFNHPGGLQTLGRYLLVPLEMKDESSDKARVFLYDSLGTRDPWSCNQATGAGCLRKVWGFVVAGTGAGTVSAAQLDDGRYLMITTQRGITKLEVHVSQRGKVLTDPTLFGSWGSYEALWVGRFPDWTDYQNLNLLIGCNAQLYLLASHKSEAPVVPVEDLIDLFELHLVPDGKTNADGDPTLSVSLTKVANRHVYCSTLGDKTQCHLQAAGGAWVDPQGRLFFYAAEHDNDGPDGTVKMMEFRPGDHLDNPGTPFVEGCPTLPQAYVELFDGANHDGNSLMIDFRDRAKRNYDHFDTAFSFNDRTRSARQCIPAGYRYRLWININKTGPSFDLLGTGNRRSYQWPTKPGFSSGCFHDGVRCL
jgi:hypothetical protein